jgi:hypothetical protein
MQFNLQYVAFLIEAQDTETSYILHPQQDM